jgi:hypothetical protein
MYLLFAVAMALLVLIALRTPVLARFDEQVPDAAPDDLIGLEARQRRLTSAPEPVPGTHAEDGADLLARR